jgi:aminoglycoside 2'-N-acetyltransferase I
VLSVPHFSSADASAATLDEIHRLMLDAFEGDFDQHDWEHTVGGTHVVALDGEEIVGHAALLARTLFVGEHPVRTGYVEGVAVAPARQGEGIGSVVMADVGALITRDFELGGLGTGRHSFYERLGWERWHGPTFVRRGRELVRSEEDDDGVMVLRVGPSRAVDLTGSISCEARSGDDW